MAEQEYQALIFGASGITGWALTRECLVYPSPTTFARVIGLTRRYLSKDVAMLPNQSDKWELYSGMDLERGVDVAVEKLSSIKDVDQVTHVYFTSYTAHGSDYQTLKHANVTILENAVRAVEKVCPKLLFWTLQTGGKAYGIEFVDKGIEYNPPLKESMPRIPEPYASNIFYYPQYDTLASLSEGKRWKFCEIRPDAIIGFVPQNNAMNLAQAIGLFLALYVSFEGKGVEVPFPGDEAAYKALHTDTSQDILARFHIYASLNPNSSSRRAFNVADGEVTTWEKVWPAICDYFGLKGTRPTASRITGAQYVLEHKDKWSNWVSEHGLKEGALEGTSWDFMSGIMGSVTFNRQYDLSASREVGFTETVSTVMGYALTFDRMRAAKIIP